MESHTDTEPQSLNVVKLRIQQWLIPTHFLPTTEVRLAMFWEARNVKNGGELMSVDMILLDAKVTPKNSIFSYCLFLRMLRWCFGFDYFSSETVNYKGESSVIEAAINLPEL